jgi:hypothetical protein
VFALPSTPGALFKALSVFALREINLSKLESRPLRGPPWEYLFYIEVDARADERRARRRLRSSETLRRCCAVLGTYKAPSGGGPSRSRTAGAEPGGAMRALGRTVAMVRTGAGRSSEAPRSSRAEPREPADGSMAALTAEVRELRMAVQQLAQTQSQNQALGVYLSVQTEPRAAGCRHNSTPHEKSSTPPPSRPTSWPRSWPTSTSSCRAWPIHRKRNAIQGASRGLRREHALLSAREQQARNREQELSQSLQTEESRWSALVSRLEALTAR